MIASTSDLASALGLTPRRINQLAAEGSLVKTGPGQFDFMASVKTYIASLQEAAGKAEGKHDLKREQTRLVQAQADAAALKNQKLRQELVSVEEVKTGWQEICTKIRTRMAAVPLTLRAKMPGLTAYDVRVIEQEVQDVLAELDT